jgi:Flp pilus assembly protein TadD
MTKTKARQAGQGPAGSPARLGIERLFWLIPLVAIVVYANTFTADFTYDDLDVVAKNTTLRSLAGIPGLFTSTYWAGLDSASDKSLYRPLTMTTYALEYQVHGLKPGWFHVVNVLLHALVSLALYLVAKQVSRDGRVAFAAALLFAVHPIHTEAVSNVVGRAEILALAGMLGTIAAYLREMSARGRAIWLWGALSVLSYLGAMMSKEVGITAPALILLTEIVFPRCRHLLKGSHRAVATFLGFGGAAAVFLLLRAGAVTNRVAHVGLAHTPTPERILTALRVLAEYVGLLLAPVRLTADYWLVPLARGPWDRGFLAAVLTLVALCAAGLWSWKRRSEVAWGLGFAAITIFPVSNLPFAIGVMKAERLLYSPSAGFLVAVGGVLAALTESKRGRRAGLLILFLAAIVLSGLTVRRNADWHDNRALAAATLRRTPASPSFNVVMGNWYREHKDNVRAREHYARAVEALPTDKVSIYNLGNIELDQGRLEEAISYYRRAIALDPGYANAVNNLGSAYQKLGRYQEAADMYLRFKNLKPDSPYPLLNLMAVYIDAKDYRAALALAEEAMQRFPDNADIQYNAAALYGALGRTEDADRALGRARALDKSASRGGPPTPKSP